MTLHINKITVCYVIMRHYCIIFCNPMGRAVLVLVFAYIDNYKK